MSQFNYDINEAYVAIFGARDFEHDMSVYPLFNNERQKYHLTKFEAFDSALNLIRPLITEPAEVLGQRARDRNEDKKDES